MCCGLTPIGISAPQSHFLPPPQWDEEENEEGIREKTHELR